MAHLQLEVGDDRGQVRVPASLAVAIHAALDVRGAGVDRRQRVRHRDVGVVVRVDANDAVEPLPDVRHEPRHALGRRTAIGVAEAQHVGAGVVRGLERPERVVGVGLIAVEEMLRVVDHLFAVILEVLHGLGDEQQVLVEGRSRARGGRAGPTSCRKSR